MNRLNEFAEEIELDTNIQIKLDVDAPDASAEYLERGYDAEKKMHFYKVFFNYFFFSIAGWCSGTYNQKKSVGR